MQKRQNQNVTLFYKKALGLDNSLVVVICQTGNGLAVTLNTGQIALVSASYGALSGTDR